MKSGQRVGNWIIDRSLGHGGMAEVYLAHHATLGMAAAVKALLPRLTDQPEFHARFSQEARTQSSLRHPHIGQVFDFLEIRKRYFIVMEYLPGGSLAERVEKEGSLAVEDALKWSTQVLEALDHAHQKGVVHRDIKPSNILLDDSGNAKITDFGIALALSAPRLTSTGIVVGTPHYMSPEQIARPQEVDHRTDVYSMGIVVYELLSGRPPFDGESQFRIQMAQLNEQPQALHAVNPRVPRPLSDTVAKALAKDPNDRYSGCGEFASRLQRLRETPASVARVEEPQTAAGDQAPPWRSRLSKPVVAGSAVAVLTAGLVIAGMHGGNKTTPATPLPPSPKAETPTSPTPPGSDPSVPKKPLDVPPATPKETQQPVPRETPPTTASQAPAPSSSKAWRATIRGLGGGLEEQRFQVRVRAPSTWKAKVSGPALIVGHPGGLPEMVAFVTARERGEKEIHSVLQVYQRAKRKVHAQSRSKGPGNSTEYVLHVTDPKGNQYTTIANVTHLSDSVSWWRVMEGIDVPSGDGDTQTLLRKMLSSMSIELAASGNG